MANGTYKDYTIENDNGYITIYSGNGAIAGQGYKNVVEAMIYIDRDFKESTIDISIPVNEHELFVKLNFAYQNGYNSGAAEAYQKGYDDGASKAYTEGYRDGGRAAANDIYEAK